MSTSKEDINSFVENKQATLFTERLLNRNLSWNATFVSVITINQRFKNFTALDNHDERSGFVFVQKEL